MIGLNQVTEHRDDNLQRKTREAFGGGAGEVIEKYVVAGVEQIGPFLSQMFEEVLLVRQEPVVTTVKRVLFGPDCASRT